MPSFLKKNFPPRLVPEGHPLDLLGRLKDLPLQHLTVLNLGAGICGSPISEQLHFLPCERLVHVEKFGPYMDQLKTMTFAAKSVEFHQVDICEFLARPSLPVIDIVLMIDVLEHLSREDGERALQKLMEITRRRILIWAPLGECPVEPIHDNPYQVHLSTWHADDPAFQGHTVEHFKGYHQHLDPPADAGWIIINTDKPSRYERLMRKLQGR